MKVPFRVSFFFSSKYFRKRKKASLSVILGVAIGVAVLLSFLALTNGYRQSLVDRILGVDSHIQVMSRHGGAIYNYANNQSQIEGLSGVADSQPHVFKTGLVQRGNHIHDVRLQGINPQKPPEVELQEGSWQTLEQENSGSNKDVVLGVELSETVGAYPGDNITFTFAEKGRKKFKVVGLFDARLQQYNERVAYTSFTVAQEMFDMRERASLIAVEVNDPFQVREISHRIEEETGYFARNWKEANENLLAAMEMERRLFSIILVFILVVAGFGMANLLNMLVMEKEKEIGILLAMGCPLKRIKWVFLLLGVKLGAAGAVLGIILGVIITYLLSRYPIQIPGDVYNVEYLQFQFEIHQFVLVSSLAIVVAAAASFFPARRATGFEVIEVLKDGR